VGYDVEVLEAVVASQLVSANAGTVIVVRKGKMELVPVPKYYTVKVYGGEEI
jgi:hypothetical protein